jgi:hypothetical protein
LTNVANALAAEPVAIAEATWKRDWRTVLWPALAVAAALLLLVFSPSLWSPPAERQGQPSAAIAGKAPAIGLHGEQSQSEGDVANNSTAPAPASFAERPSRNSPPADEVASDTAPGSQGSTVAPTKPPAYIVAEVAAETLRQSNFAELLQSQGIRLESDVAPGRSTSRFTGPLANPSAKEGIEEGNRAQQPAEAVYLITAPREQVDQIIAALGGQPDTYNIVDQTALPDAVDSGSQDGDVIAPPAVARRFGSRAAAEAAAGESSKTAANRRLVNVIVVLRTSAH